MLIEDGLELLTEDECWRLLGRGEVGRIGVTIAALPVIFPVNYTVIDDTILFRTSAGSKLAAAARQAVVAFEVDDYERTNRDGWSVLAVGRSEVVHDLGITAQVLAAGLEPWAEGRRTDLVRITPGFLSGRRIVHAIGQRPASDGGAPAGAVVPPARPAQPSRRQPSMTLDTQPRLTDLSLRPIVTIGPDASLRAAAEAMRAANISSLVVDQPAEPVSILTERDLARALADGLNPDAPLGAVASPSPLTIDVDATAIDAATRMLREAVRHLVVTRGNRAVGVVSMRDLLGVLVQALTPDAVYVMIQQAWCDLPENWPG